VPLISTCEHADKVDKLDHHLRLKRVAPTLQKNGVDDGGEDIHSHTYIEYVDGWMGMVEVELRMHVAMENR
jgi:hypothetical protein